MAEELVSTICPCYGCSRGYGPNLVGGDDRVIGVEPWMRHPVNEGRLRPGGNVARGFFHRNGRPLPYPIKIGNLPA